MDRVRRLPLHWQIAVAMIAGILAGWACPTDHTRIEVDAAGGPQILAGWARAVLVGSDGARQTFFATESKPLEEAFDRLAAAARPAAASTSAERARPGVEFHWSDHRTVRLDSVAGLVRVRSWIVTLRPLGFLFLNLLKMVAVPLVVASLIGGAASLHSARRIARIGGKTLAFFILSTAVAISIGLLAGNLVRPGSRLSPDTAAALMAGHQGRLAVQAQTDRISFNLGEFLVQAVPSNVFASVAQGDMLPIVFFAVFFGLVAGTLETNASDAVIKLCDSINRILIKMVSVIMRAAPVGVFVLIGVTVAELGFDVVFTLIGYVLTVVGALLFHMIVVYGGCCWFLGGVSPWLLFAAMRRAWLVAFTSSSSAATLPVNMECAGELGCPPSITSFVLPLGATINMDGTALYQGVAALFIGQVYGIDLGWSAQLTIIVTATLASIGTAPVPGVGIVMLMIVLRSVGIPETGVVLILGVDRLLDMLRTVANITGDTTAAVVVSASEGLLGAPRISDGVDPEIPTVGATQG